MVPTAPSTAVESSIAGRTIDFSQGIFTYKAVAETFLRVLAGKKVLRNFRSFMKDTRLLRGKGLAVRVVSS